MFYFLLLRRQIPRRSHLNQWSTFFLNIGSGYGHLSYIVILRNLIHYIKHKFLYYGAQRSGTGLFLKSLLSYSLYRIIVKLKLDLIEFKKLLILLEYGILRLLENLYQHLFIQTL